MGPYLIRKYDAPEAPLNLPWFFSRCFFLSLVLAPPRDSNPGPPAFGAGAITTRPNWQSSGGLYDLAMRYI